MDRHLAEDLDSGIIGMLHSDVPWCSPLYGANVLFDSRSLGHALQYEERENLEVGTWCLARDPERRLQ